MLVLSTSNFQGQLSDLSSARQIKYHIELFSAFLGESRQSQI